MIRPSAENRIEAGAAMSQAPADRCVCIHLGMPKTATTCIQQHLFAKHSQIAYLGKFPRQNNKFPSKAVQALNAHLLGKVSPRVRRCRFMIAELIAPAQVAGRVPLWSKEGLTAGGAAHKRRQAQTFRRIVGDAKVIIFVRRPLKFMESMYFQDLKGFQKPSRRPPAWARRFGRLPRYFTIDEWLDAIWSLPKKGALGHLWCAETADIYAHVFGRQRVALFVFEQFVEDPEATIGELCRFIGVDPAEGVRLLKGKRANDRWTDTQIERLKRIERSPWRSLLFRRGSRGIRNRLLGFDPKGERTSGPAARAEIPPLWQERVLDFARSDCRRLVEHWNLPLERYGYPL